MSGRHSSLETYKVPLSALADAAVLWSEGFEGPITIIDTTVRPPVVSKLIQLATGEVLTSSYPYLPSSN